VVGETASNGRRAFLLAEVAGHRARGARCSAARNPNPGDTCEELSTIPAILPRILKTARCKGTAGTPTGK